jgi:3-hydroxyacyl-CoA dehydrogenase
VTTPKTLPCPVACIGAGPRTGAWAIVFARAGHHVRVHAAAEGTGAAAVAFAAAMLPALAAADLLAGADPAAVLARIRAVPTLEAALAGALYVQACAPPESPDDRRALFARLDAAAEARAVLAAAGARPPPAADLEPLAGRRRCLAVEVAEPPYAVRAARLVPAPWTGSAALARAAAVLRAAGLAPERASAAREGTAEAGVAAGGGVPVEAGPLAEELRRVGARSGAARAALVAGADLADGDALAAFVGQWREGYARLVPP